MILSEFLHTEIAKIIKTDQELDGPFRFRDLCFFAISVWVVFSDRIFYTLRSLRSLRPIRFGWPFRVRDPLFLCDLCDLRVGSAFPIGFLHTEIAKITKTDQDWMTLFESVTPVPLRPLRSPCGIGFSDRILHTEIAKIAKTDSDWMNLSIP
jgi:hypothetical protein